MTYINLLITFLLYPGLLSALALAAAFELLTTGRTALPATLGQLWRGLGERETLLALAGAGLRSYGGPAALAAQPVGG